jgi:large subunit ribosomal protein L3
LTADNAQFLREAVIDQYEDKLRVVGSPLKDGPWQRNTWTPRTLRTGVLALKIGVIPQWTKSGEKFHTTLLQVLDNHVIRYIPPECYSNYPLYKRSKWPPNKYGCVVVGALSCQPFHFTKAYCGLFTEAGVPPKRKLTSFLVTPDAAVQPGTPLYVSHFRVGDYIDVQAKTIGHGFQGVVKRWGFKGGPASHGTTKWHRRPGNIAGGRGKGKVWKGKKMPGHMGMKFRTLKGLKIWRIDTKYNILYVHGPGTPGPTHCYVRVFDTTLPNRRQRMVSPETLPMPTFYPDDVSEPLPEEIFDKDLFQFSEPSVTFAPEPKDKAKAKSKSK